MSEENAVWPWIREGVRYTIVILAALVTASLIVAAFPTNFAGPCIGCVTAAPQLRAECDKQFFGTGVRAKQLDAGAEDEFLVAYYESTVVNPVGAETSTMRDVRGPGYVIVRAQPQFGFNNPSQSSSTDKPSPVSPETVWRDVTVTVARYVSQLRNDSTCSQTAVRFRDRKFEFYCELPNRVSDEDGGQTSYRVFIRNESNVPIEYCIISNCDASAPYGQGSLCMAEQASDAATPQKVLLPPGPSETGSYPMSLPPRNEPKVDPQPSTAVAPKAPLAPSSAYPQTTPPATPDPETTTKPPLPEVDQAVPAKR